ncbi:MAG: hypothetical protein GXY81_01650 [Candidatus Cloacimonetes bacterium]|nr:hypothetical protein [Candidatus Cloacimonadota bacterium]
MSFKKDVLKHMGDYKREVLKIEDNGKWWLNKKENHFVTHDHILPVIDGESSAQKYSDNNIRKQNILPEYRNECWDYIKKEKINLHRFFHHLNSSQAMCLNLFYPFVVNDLSNASIISAIQSKCRETIPIEGPRLMNYNFEYESSLDRYNGQKPTNFDLCISGESTKLLFEVKYTEEGFGGIDKKKKATYVEKYKNLYEKMASKVISNEWNKCDNFIDNYQIMRNLVHIDNSTYLIFLYPEKNVTVKNQAIRARYFVKPEFQTKLICMTWETLFQNVFNALLEVDAMDSFLEQYLLEFRDKYLYWIDIPK